MNALMGRTNRVNLQETIRSLSTAAAIEALPSAAFVVELIKSSLFGMSRVAARMARVALV